MCVFSLRFKQCHLPSLPVQFFSNLCHAPAETGSRFGIVLIVERLILTITPWDRKWLPHPAVRPALSRLWIRPPQLAPGHPLHWHFITNPTTQTGLKVLVCLSQVLLSCTLFTWCSHCNPTGLLSGHKKVCGHNGNTPVQRAGISGFGRHADYR